MHAPFAIGVAFVLCHKVLSHCVHTIGQLALTIAAAAGGVVMVGVFILQRAAHNSIKHLRA
jgi:hypothetical protein